MDSAKADVLAEVCDALLDGNSDSAKEKLRAGYPFKPIETIARRYSVSDSMEQFMRDGFIDRYTGNRLVNPGALRLLHVLLGEDFPAHQNWKVSETHSAFWELFPTIDHVEPISRGGVDDKENWVTASMLSNRVKDQWTLEDLGWGLHPAGDVKDWDGLSRWLVDYLAANSTALEKADEIHRRYIRRWHAATKPALETRPQSP